MPIHRRIRRSASTAAVLLTALACAGAIAATPAAAGSTQSTTAWQENLSQSHVGDVNTVWTGHALTVRDHGFRPAAGKSGGYGLALLPAHQLAAPTDRVAVATTDQTPAGTHVDVDVRGQRTDGTWTEWISAAAAGPTRLAATVTDVQTRLMLHGTASGLEPAVTAVTVTPAPADAAGMKAATANVAAAATPLSYKVFATDENDVGGTTSNGHIIQPNDHFVALPSTNVMSPLNSGEYSVQVCAVKCVTAPVWDTGPWDIHNNYWDPASQRSEFTDLPQGKPEAQAAYQDGYNGGKDDFYGQTILNPAGIDLADGTFADTGLTDNGWVTVTYLWTGSAQPPAAPSVSITSPVASGLVGGNVTVSASASDATSGAALSTQFYVDGAAYGSAVGGSSPSITWDSSGVNGTHTLTATTTASTGGGNASTTSAAVAVNVRNRFQAAFTASGGNILYLYGNGTGAIEGSTPVGVAPGTHPAIAELAGGGFQVAFTANSTNQLYLYGVGPGSVTGSTPAGVAAGTSPAITALPGGGFQTVFAASGGNTLWRYGSGAGSYTGSTPVGVAAGTSPAVTTLSNGSIQVAFNAASTNKLYLYGDG
ncbi:Ig-like domain-containing protein, partial [Catenulispora rubra]|uniref:Ig-like domain-containing protein n=1 Tax=Catenulispora rubra TaxID=280293 RepID=UPI0018924EC3